MTRVVTRAIQVSWLVVAAGIALQLMFAWDGMILGSGLSIIWLGAIGVLLATRMRQVLIRYGTLAGIFGNWLWTSAFLFVAVGWLVWYAWIPLQN